MEDEEPGSFIASICQLAETTDKAKDATVKRELKRLLKHLIACAMPETETVRVVRLYVNPSEGAGTSVEIPPFPHNGD